MPLKPRPLVLAGLTLLVLAAGCVGLGLDEASTSTEDPEPNDQPTDASDYEPPPRDEEMSIKEFTRHIEGGTEGVELHVRVISPVLDEPVPVVVEVTPYRALEPRQDRVYPAITERTEELVQRGFALAEVDVRGTGDSGGCFDFGGPADLADMDALTEWLGTRTWSNGSVLFQGLSYDGGMALLAGLADNQHLAGIVPMLAPTSEYDYHYKDGVPYRQALGTSLALYSGEAIIPTLNAHADGYVDRQVEKTDCSHEDRILNEGLLDQSGEYTGFWEARDLNQHVEDVSVPVLWLNGLDDWNVKPDHLDPFFNELDTRKTLVAPQIGHDNPWGISGPFGDWHTYHLAFLDETLNGADTGLFDQDQAWVQDSTGDWHHYEDEWPPQDPDTTTVNLTQDGLSLDQAPEGDIQWEALPSQTTSFEETQITEEALNGEPTPENPTQVILESKPLPETIHTAGTPKVNLTIQADADTIHLVAVLEARSPGEDEWERINQGYLDPVYRAGIQDPKDVPDGAPTPVTIEMYPQEDILQEGDRIRLILRSDDGGPVTGTIPTFDPTTIHADLAGERPGQLVLPEAP